MTEHAKEGHKPNKSGSGMAAQSVDAEAFLCLGMQISGVFGWQRCQRATNVDRFTSYFGVIPETCAWLWQALRNSADVEVKLVSKDKPRDLLVGLRFLFLYETEHNLGLFFGIRSRTTVGKLCRKWIAKIQSLLDEEVSG